MNTMTIQLDNGKIHEKLIRRELQTPAEVCEWLLIPLLQNMGYEHNDIEKCFNSDYFEVNNDD